MFSFMKAKVWPWLIAIAGVVLSVFVVIVRRTMKENSRLKARVENAQAKVNHARVVAKRDMELIQDEQQREVQIVKELQELQKNYNPNDLFKKKDER